MESNKNSITSFQETLHEPLYIQLYNYYRKLIEEGTLTAGTKLPSIRRCALERRLSRTTVETAYMQLAAEGYVVAQAGSGFYVSHLDYPKPHTTGPKNYMAIEHKETILYDFASTTVDGQSFNFDVWRRYVKSALRNTERLLSYGDVQGEYDLRVAISNYVREKRGVVCTPEQIVIGAGMQTLLHLLCSLLGNAADKTVAFTGSNFKQGKAIFDDRGYTTKFYGMVTDEMQPFIADRIKILYTSPSHTTPWGDMMPMQTRLKLLQFARSQKCLIIEDDYDSEFSYYSRPTPSLQGIDGGENVVYMGTFSKILLPSLRMSFMVLPLALMPIYAKKRSYYNQTASKAEQIALCQFMRDGHFEKQIRKARKIYLSKKEALCEAITAVFGETVEVQTGPGGFWVRMGLSEGHTSAYWLEKGEHRGVKVKLCDGEAGGLLLSCSGVSEEQFEAGLKCLKEALST